MSSTMLTQMQPTDRENWWEQRSSKLGSSSSSNFGVQSFGLQTPSRPSFSQSLESILARSDLAAANNGMDLAQSAPTTVTGEAVTFEELINSQNAQIREFAVLDQQPLSQDWAILGNTNPVTPSNFKALQSLSDSLMMSQRFANAIVAV